jgi:hypothetical protein
MKPHAFFTCTALNPAVRRIAVFVLVLGGLNIAVSPANAQDRFSLKIKNSSKYGISRLYVASSEDEKWGPDQLGKHTIDSGDTFTLTDLLPGEYDIKFVNEYGDECVLRKIGVFKSISWALTTDWLEKCEKASNVPNLTGNWVGYYNNGSRSEYVWAIRQTGSTLSIENVGGGQRATSRGRIEGNRVYALDFASKNGTLSADGTRITWSDGVVWVRQ